MSNLRSHSTEETWSQLQERLRKKREVRKSPSGGGLGTGYDHGRERRRSVPPNPLPRLDSPSPSESLNVTSPELRGSHYSKVPPLTTHRSPSDDTLSLESFNSDTAITDTSYLAPPSQSRTTHPFRDNETFQPSQATARTRVPVWDPYTGRKTGYETREPPTTGSSTEQQRRGKRKYYVRQPSIDVEGDIQDAMRANEMDSLVRRRDEYQDQVNRDRGRLQEYDNVFGGSELIREPASRSRDPTAFERMQDGLFSSTFLEYFLTSCLQDDMVLDVVLDVMADVREEREIERRVSQPVLDVGEEILNEVVHETLREVVHIEIRGAVQGFWSTALESPAIYKPIARDLLREVIDEEVTSLIPECIADLVSEYFVQKEVVGYYNLIEEEVIAELVPEVVVDAVYDESITAMVDLLIQDEIVSYASSFMEDTFAPGRPRVPASPDERLREEDEIFRLADEFLLEVAIFENLFSTRLLPNQQVWSEDEYLDLFMDSLLLDEVLGEQLDVMKRRDGTEKCLPLKRFHEKICTNVAIDVVMDELTQHLDEDMADLDEHEVMLDASNWPP